MYSLDREAFPSLNGLPGETLHSVSPKSKCSWAVLYIGVDNFSGFYQIIQAPPCIEDLFDILVDVYGVV